MGLFTLKATVHILGALLASIAPAVALVPRQNTQHTGPPENWLINLSVLAVLNTLATSLTTSSGDSYSKTGFKPEGDQPSAGNPIGNPALPGTTSSGGLNWLGYLVTDFNTSFSSDENSLTLAYNFARPGGTLNRQPFGSKNPDFGVQIDWFEENYVNIDKQLRRWTPLNSVVSVFYGVNDINGIFAKNLDQDNNNIGLITDLMKDYMAGLERLYGFGLRKYIAITAPRKSILVTGLFNLLTSLALNMLPLKLKWEVEKLNQLSSCVWLWNRLIRENVKRFKERHEDVVIRIVETEPIFWDAFMDPSAYNAPDTTCRDNNGDECVRLHALVNHNVH